MSGTVRALAKSKSSSVVTCGNCWSGAVVVLIATGRANRSAVGTLVDRTSRYVRLIHLPDGRRAHHLQVGLVAAMADLPTEARRTLTWGQGSEMPATTRSLNGSSTASSTPIPAGRGNARSTRTPTD